jgi:hypothetical protein
MSKMKIEDQISKSRFLMQYNLKKTALENSDVITEQLHRVYNPPQIDPNLSGSEIFVSLNKSGHLYGRKNWAGFGTYQYVLNSNLEQIPLSKLHEYLVSMGYGFKKIRDKVYTNNEDESQPITYRRYVWQKGLQSNESPVSTIEPSKPGSQPPSSGETTPGKTSYRPCTEFPFTLGCINQAIGEIQKCLGIRVDNYFGPGTSKALVSKGLDGNTITQEVYTKIKTELCGASSDTNTRLSSLMRVIRQDGNVYYSTNNLEDSDYKLVTGHLGKTGYVPTNDPDLVTKYRARHIWINNKISPTLPQVRHNVSGPNYVSNNNPTPKPKI